ncbi:MAG: ABC transporter substrate-binding protein [Rhodospirillales bacterium]|nr:ABC transporter substrate-binding protein [Rhodospirillales bacterium]
MFKKISVIASAALAFGLMQAPATAADKFVNGIDANFPPFAYVDKSGKPGGFDVDSVDWIAKKMGFEVSHQPVVWDGIIPSLLAKKIDFICSGMSITEERAKQVNFTNPYWEVKNVFVVKKDSGVTTDDLLKGDKKIGVQQGTPEGDWLKDNKEKNGWNFTIRYYDSSPMAVEDVLNGRIDAAGMNDAPAKDATSKKPVKIAGVFGEVDTFGCAVRKEDTALLNKLNDGYKALMADQHWQDLIAKYKP